MADSSKTRVQEQLEGTEIHEKVLRTFRCLVADLCQQFDGGHPGGAMSMAAIGVALYRYVMVYSPLNPQYFNRDRLVLSNGHVCLMQYILMHLTGFTSMTLEQLKSYRSARLDSLCPGSTRIQNDGIEASTGALGQGVANAVGMAVVAKNLGATYNKPGHSLIDNMIWCTVGDACLQEGVALEAIQLAGQWRLDNLAVIYDNNQITCCGSVDVTCCEDIDAKMRACGWNVINVSKGVDNVDAIVRALNTARNHQGHPTFINIRTIIAFGSSAQGQAKTHSDALGVEDVAKIKRRFDMNPEEHFTIAADVYEFFDGAKSRGAQHEAEYERKLKAYSQDHPELAINLKLRMKGITADNWHIYMPMKECLPTEDIATRETAAYIFETLAKRLSYFMIGTADLKPAFNMSWEDHVVFQHPALKTACGMYGDYSGRYMHCGIREHAMVSIANGMAAFNPGSILPFTSGFLMFYIYAAAGVRLSAVQGLQTIHLATHDSIVIGDDGPTHQTIELPALFRAMPNLLYIRPCDADETCGAFIVALESKGTPSVLSLSRNALRQFPQHSSRDGVKSGAYVFIEQDSADVTLIGVGSEMKFAVETREILKALGIKVRVVSFPCQRLFEMQSQEYKERVMQYSKQKPIVVIEAYAVNGWERYADAGYSMRSFGKSLPAGDETYKFFNFESEKMAGKIKQLLEDVENNGIGSLRGNFRDLNGGAMGIGLNFF